MDIFNQVKKSISQGSKTAIQKTKDIAEIAKLNGDISDAEQRITAAYQEIGQHYTQWCIENSMEEKEPKIQEILQIKKDIAQWQEEIKILKGVTKCPHCGGDVTAASGFCPNCGHAIEKTPTPAQTAEACPGCGAPVTPGLKFCRSCGMKLEAAPPAEEKTCPKCGTRITPEDVFCPNCGEAVGSHTEG